MSVPKVTNICTEIFQPIYWDKADTTDTIKQVKKHNAVWDKLSASNAN